MVRDAVMLAVGLVLLLTQGLVRLCDKLSGTP